MADTEQEIEEGSSMNAEEELLAKHRKEKKELQAQIQALKKTATKGDKKKKKEVTEEISKLENDMEARHQLELKQFKESTEVQKLSENLEETLGTDKKEETVKVTKAQKRRDKKQDQAKERQRQIEEQEVANLQGMRHIETEKIKKILAEQNLKFYDIPSDGNCMYAAIVHQINQGASAQQRTIQQLRTMAAEYMRSHPEEFSPFMDNVSTDEQYAKYCDDVQKTLAWGSQLELRALSQVLRRPFKVVQAEGRPVVVGEEFVDSSSPPVTLTYHRHMFGLGEHYNSVQPRPVEEEEEKTT